MNPDLENSIPPVMPGPRTGQAGRTGLLLSLVAPAAVGLMLAVQPG